MKKINSSVLGLSCGLISQYMWEHGMRFYYFDLSRSTNADLSTSRNLNISFNNNNQVAIDIWCFCESYSECIMDVETGMLSV